MSEDTMMMFGNNVHHKGEAVDLVAMNIPFPMWADHYFGRTPGLIIARPGRNSCKPYFTIPAGYYAIVSSYGAEIDFDDTTPLWPAGFHFGSPFTQVDALVTKQAIVFDVPVANVVTADNVALHIDVVLTFRIIGDETKGEDPRMVKDFVHRVQPSELKIRLQAAVSQAVKSMARSIKHTEAYGLVGVQGGQVQDTGAIATHTNIEQMGIGELEATSEGPDEIELTHGAHEAGVQEAADANIMKGLNVAKAMHRSLDNTFNKDGVDIVDVVIESVRFHDRKIHDQLEGKTMVVSENSNERMTQQRTMQDIKYKEEIETKQQKYKEFYVEAEQDGARRVNEASLALQQLKADVHKEVKMVETNGQVRCENMRAQANLELEALRQDRNLLISNVKAQAVKDAKQMENDTEKEVKTMLAEAELNVAKNKAQGDKMISQAEGDMVQMVAVKKEFETEKKKLDVFRGLAHNREVVMGSGTSEDVNSMLLADEILKANKGGPVSRSTMMAELMLGRSALKFHVNGE